MRLLLIEDEKRLAEALRETLQNEKYEVDCCFDGLSGLEGILTGVYDVIILDVMLPFMNGFDVAKKARKEGVSTPILMLTAKSELEDKVEGLDCGADDYLTKPFMTKELLARIRALLRRNNNRMDDLLKYGDIVLDAGNYSLCNMDNNEKVQLSDKEFKIMEYFINNHGQILTREQLAVKIWGFENEAEYNNVEVYMSFTRKKLKYIESKTTIKAIRGIGYELRCDDV